ncbi:MAG: formylglycine-generating enzyme family protein [Acidobacteriota bacterium]
MKHLIITFHLLLALFPLSGKDNIDHEAYLKSLAPDNSSMIHIPAGVYYTGDKGSTDNSPLIKRKFKEFFIDIHPVTNSQYLMFINKTGYKTEGKFNRSDAGANPFYPVTGVTLKDAEEFAEFAGKRLPTEWEWEAAARALKENYNNQLSTIYKEKKGIFYQMDRKKIAPVFSTPPNEIGLYDHIGNIFEWTEGEYPVELLTGKHKSRMKVGVIRGGAWTNIRNDIKYSTRTPFPVKRSLHWLGFRCARDPVK